MATSYARWLLERERREVAREILMGAYQEFSEGFDVPDLIGARAVLEAVEAPG